jgi:creatinine amidohydrolase/Fe(II)-dependent formamide hydrolase-like protein
VTKLVFVNGHGGNYVLSNVVQESNVGGRRMALFPRAEDCNRAKLVARATAMQTSALTTAATCSPSACVFTRHQG